MGNLVVTGEGPPREQPGRRSEIVGGCWAGSNQPNRPETGSPAVIRCGWGPERSRCGGSAIAAILAIPSVAGKFKVRGGGYTMSNSGAWKLNSDAAAQDPETATRAINMSRIGEELHVVLPGRTIRVTVTEPRFFDLEGTRANG